MNEGMKLVPFVEICREDNKKKKKRPKLRQNER